MKPPEDTLSSSLPGARGLLALLCDHPRRLCHLGAAPTTTAPHRSRAPVPKTAAAATTAASAEALLRLLLLLLLRRLRLLLLLVLRQRAVQRSRR